MDTGINKDIIRRTDVSTISSTVLPISFPLIYSALWKTAKASLKRRCLSAGKINGNIEDE